MSFMKKVVKYIVLKVKNVKNILNLIVNLFNQTVFYSKHIFKSHTASKQLSLSVMYADKTLYFYKLLNLILLDLALIFNCTHLRRNEMDELVNFVLVV